MTPAHGLSNLPAFSAPRRKLTRAVRHIEELECSVKTYFAGRWYTSTFGPQPDGNTGLHLRVFGTPRDAELAVGDAVHNLCAALDLAVVEAVQRGGGSGNGVYFPFFEDAVALEEFLRRRKIHRATAAVQELIRNLKPYHAGNPELRALHDLDILDKHRSLIEVSVTATTPRIRVVCDERGGPVLGADGKPRVEVDPQSVPTAVFTFSKDSALAGRPLVGTLRSLWQMVSDIVDAVRAACEGSSRSTTRRAE